MNMITQETRQKIEKELIKYPEKRAALLPFLHIIQDEDGWISEQKMEAIADLLGLTAIDVKETVSFYTMFNLKPVGRYHFQVCRNISCSLLDSRHLIQYLEEKLRIQSGETRSDLACTITEVECLGYCGDAPVMMLNNDLIDNLTKEKLEDLLKRLELI